MCERERDRKPEQLENGVAINWDKEDSDLGKVIRAEFWILALNDHLILQAEMSKRQPEVLRGEV